MAPHSSTLSWKIPWTEELGRLQSMGLLRVRHDWWISLSLFTFMHWRKNGNPLQCSCLENPRDGGAWWAAVYGVAQSRTWLKWLSSIGPNESRRQSLFLEFRVAAALNPMTHCSNITPSWQRMRLKQVRIEWRWERSWTMLIVISTPDPPSLLFLKSESFILCDRDTGFLVIMSSEVVPGQGK